MVDLKLLQQDMTTYVLGQSPSTSLLSSIVETPLSAKDRLQIHRNNYRLTLSDALIGVYPIVMSFVGRDWLEASLKKFVTEHPPQMACLADYGGDFADFLGGFEPASSMPYLSDIARLEWAVHQCQNARDEKFMSAADWRNVAGPAAQSRTFKLVSAHSFIVSPYPLLDLWSVGSGEDSDREIDLESGGMILLVIRPATEVLIYPLEIKEYTFLSLLEKGECVLTAAKAVDWAHIGSPMVDAMQNFSTSGFFSAESMHEGDIDNDD